MKEFLLLAAIYALIIHQSHKNAKEKGMPAKKTIAKEFPLQVNLYEKQIAPHNFIFGNPGYASSVINVYTKWNDKE